MLRSRVSSSIDTARLSNAVSRPGIDPRIWVSYAVLTSEPYIEDIDGQQDIVVDIQLMPVGDQETARVGAIYAGNGFGLYTPLRKDDEVLVCAPSGDPDEGLVVMQRLWSPADPPPQEVYDNPYDVTLVVQKDHNLRINVKGEGNVIIGAAAGKVKLGSASAEKGVARLDDAVAAGDTPVTGMAAWIAFVNTALTALGAVVPPGAPSDFGKISAASEKVVAS